MRIERVTLTHVRIPLVEPFRISNGVVAEKDGIIVAVSADGLTGIGEASPMSGSFYSGDTPESTWDDLRQKIVPAILADQPGSVDAVNGLLSASGANPFGRAGVETAFWDLEAQRTDQPLHQMLGCRRTSVASGLAVGIYPTIADLLAAIGRYIADGYTRVKIKIQPGWDVEPLRAVRKSFGSLPLMVDANCAYSRTDFDHLKALDDFDLIMIEQPLAREDLQGHAHLRKILRTPICLDESADDPEAVRRAIQLGSCAIVNIKIQRVGGLKNAVAIHDECRAAGIPVWAGTMPELGIGSIQTAHLAGLEGFAYPTDVESSLRWFVDDIIDPVLQVRDGCISLPTGPGNGVALNHSVVRKYRVREEVFRA